MFFPRITRPLGQLFTGTLVSMMVRDTTPTPAGFNNLPAPASTNAVVRGKKRSIETCHEEAPPKKRVCGEFRNGECSPSTFTWPMRPFVSVAVGSKKKRRMDTEHDDEPANKKRLCRGGWTVCVVPVALGPSGRTPPPSAENPTTSAGSPASTIPDLILDTSAIEKQVSDISGEHLTTTLPESLSKSSEGPIADTPDTKEGPEAHTAGQDGHENPECIGAEVNLDPSASAIQNSMLPNNGQDQFTHAHYGYPQYQVPGFGMLDPTTIRPDYPSSQTGLSGYTASQTTNFYHHNTPTSRGDVAAGPAENAYDPKIDPSFQNGFSSYGYSPRSDQANAPSDPGNDEDDGEEYDPSQWSPGPDVPMANTGVTAEPADPNADPALSNSSLSSPAQNLPYDNTAVSGSGSPSVIPSLAPQAGHATLLQATSSSPLFQAQTIRPQLPSPNQTPQGFAPEVANRTPDSCPMDNSVTQQIDADPCGLGLSSPAVLQEPAVKKALKSCFRDRSRTSEKTTKFACIVYDNEWEHSTEEAKKVRRVAREKKEKERKLAGWKAGGKRLAAREKAWAKNNNMSFGDLTIEGASMENWQSREGPPIEIDHDGVAKHWWLYAFELHRTHRSEVFAMNNSYRHTKFQPGEKKAEDELLHGVDAVARALAFKTELNTKANEVVNLATFSSSSLGGRSDFWALLDLTTPKPPAKTSYADPQPTFRSRS
ncbi:uncharacterized protein L3040_006482 [Drepanopeziza brunnea f. sp. 'multigermtubi']|uniref:uncharacterized protein n=1 Tax=Drepanopeziza brunnea f. sp. 'multigermtubi' TaxID=698441 RepID=UPI00239D60CB|nr:hypothetical protein L3040_006482 [Drepanopeziza brunnea f. sp. 'multigermtubi']